MTDIVFFVWLLRCQCFLPDLSFTPLLGFLDNLLFTPLRLADLDSDLESLITSALGFNVSERTKKNRIYTIEY